MIALETDGLIDELGQTVIYTDSASTAKSVSAVVLSLGDENTLDNTYEMRMRQVKVYIPTASMVGVTLTQGVDTITADAVVYTVLERDIGTGGMYRYLCERQDLLDVQHRGRIR